METYTEEKHTEIKDLSENIIEFLNSSDNSYKPHELFCYVCGEDSMEYDAFYKAIDMLEKSGDIVLSVFNLSADFSERPVAKLISVFDFVFVSIIHSR